MYHRQVSGVNLKDNAIGGGMLMVDPVPHFSQKSPHWGSKPEQSNTAIFSQQNWGTKSYYNSNISHISKGQKVDQQWCSTRRHWNLQHFAIKQFHCSPPAWQIFCTFSYEEWEESHAQMPTTATAKPRSLSGTISNNNEELEKTAYLLPTHPQIP